MMRCLCPPWQIVYARLLRLLYKLQVQVWRLVRKHDPQPYEQSVLGFLEPRLRMLSRVSLYRTAQRLRPEPRRAGLKDCQLRPDPLSHNWVSVHMPVLESPLS